MNETTLEHEAQAAAATAPAADAGHGDEHHEHPSDWQYVKIALWLGLFTLIEVGTYFESVHNLPDWVLYVSLSVLMTVKFAVVALYFMHLKFDSKMYSRMFYGGLVLALGVYFIMMFAQNLFG